MLFRAVSFTELVCGFLESLLSVSMPPRNTHTHITNPLSFFSVSLFQFITLHLDLDLDVDLDLND